MRELNRQRGVDKGEAEREGGMQSESREKMVHPGLPFLFTKGLPLGTTCLCLPAWMVGWLRAKEAIIPVPLTRWQGGSSVLREA